MRSFSVGDLLPLGKLMHEEMYDWGGSVVFKPQRTVPFCFRRQVAVARLLLLLAIYTKFRPKQKRGTEFESVQKIIVMVFFCSLCGVSRPQKGPKRASKIERKFHRCVV